MASYMLDTDICVSIMLGPTETLHEKLLRTPTQEQVISVITLAELVFGVRISSKPKHNQNVLDAFLQQLTVVEWPEAAASHYADIRASLHRQGKMIGANDLFIAAHARSMGAVLITNNEHEFRRVRGLKIENWSTL
jgi:tRNA(fMet)-specific endonuclease VapC